MKKLTIKVDDDLHKQIKDKVHETGISMSDVVREFLHRWANDEIALTQDVVEVKGLLQEAMTKLERMET